MTISPPKRLHLSTIVIISSTEGTPSKKWHERIIVVPYSLQALLIFFPVSFGASISRSAKEAPARIAASSFTSASSQVPLPSPATLQVATSGVSEAENRVSISFSSRGQRSSLISAIPIAGRPFSRISRISSRLWCCMVVQIIFLQMWDQIMLSRQVLSLQMSD